MHSCIARRALPAGEEFIIGRDGVT